MMRQHSFLQNFVKQFKNTGGLKQITQQTKTVKEYDVLDSVSVVKKITEDDVKRFCELSGDSNPVHLEDDSQKAIVHGALLNSLVSGVIGMQLPGPGTLVVSQSLTFPNKCFTGETVKITVRLLEKRKLIKVAFVCEVEEENKVVLDGDAKLILLK